jgi:hypothetical protein
MQKNKILHFLFILQSSLFVNLRRLQTIWLLFFVKCADSKSSASKPLLNMFKGRDSANAEWKGSFNKILHLEKLKKGHSFFKRGETVWL